MEGEGENFILMAMVVTPFLQDPLERLCTDLGPLDLAGTIFEILFFNGSLANLVIRPTCVHVHL